MLNGENKKAKILYVDDSETDREIFRRLLTEDNFEVSLASNGAECVNMAYQQSPDCIIMDCKMPVMDGFEACSQLKSSDQTKFIPIVLITGYDSENAIIKGLESGADDFMGKTVNHDIILAKINAMLRAKYLQDELKAMVVRDSLTHLYNYDYFLEISKQEFARSRRYNTHLALLMFDIDFFKKVNDTFGHPAGDRVLQQIGNALVRLVRHCDIVARYGGEEFAIILPETGTTSAKVLAQRVRRGIEQMEIEYNGQEISITISCGLACREVDIAGTNRTVLIEQSDQALYKAKKNGRNRVET